MANYAVDDLPALLNYLLNCSDEEALETIKLMDAEDLNSLVKDESDRWSKPQTFLEHFIKKNKRALIGSAIANGADLYDLNLESIFSIAKFDKNIFEMLDLLFNEADKLGQHIKFNFDSLKEKDLPILLSIQNYLALVLNESQEPIRQQYIDLFNDLCNEISTRAPDTGHLGEVSANMFPFSTNSPLLDKDWIIQKLKQSHNHLQPENNANMMRYHNIKLLAHHLNLKGEVFASFPPQVARPQVSLEGFYTTVTFPEIAHSFEEFVHDPDIQNRFDGRTKVLNNVIQSLRLSANLLTNHTLATRSQLIHDGLRESSIVVASGFRGHSANFLLGKGKTRTMILNRGIGSEGNNAGVRSSTIGNPSVLTPELITDMQALSLKTMEDYREFTDKTLQDQLDLEFDDILHTKGQSAGTCTMTSMDMGVLGLLYDALLQEGLSKKEAKEEAQEIFKAWSVFDRNWALDRYINNELNKPYCFDLLMDALYKQHNPSKEDELYRGQKIIAILQDIDKEQFKWNIIKYMAGLRKAHNTQGYAQFADFLRKNNLQELVSAEEKKHDAEVVNLLKIINDPKKLSSMVTNLDLIKVDIFAPYNGKPLFETLYETVDNDEKKKKLMKIKKEIVNYLIIEYYDTRKYYKDDNHSYLKHLLDNGADFKAKIDLKQYMNNATPDDLAFMIDNAYLSVNEKDKDGKTLIMAACESNNVEAARYLAKRGADLSAVDNAGKGFEDYVRKVRSDTGARLHSTKWEVSTIKAIKDATVNYSPPPPPRKPVVRYSAKAKTAQAHETLTKDIGLTSTDKRKP